MNRYLDNCNVNFTGHQATCNSMMDDDGKAYPAFTTMGCGCCQTYMKVTEINIQAAIRDAREWLEFLEQLKPVEYPPSVEEP